MARLGGWPKRTMPRLPIMSQSAASISSAISPSLTSMSTAGVVLVRIPELSAAG